MDVEIRLATARSLYEHIENLYHSTQKPEITNSGNTESEQRSSSRTSTTQISQLSNKSLAGRFDVVVSDEAVKEELGKTL